MASRQWLTERHFSTSGKMLSSSKKGIDVATPEATRPNVDGDAPSNPSQDWTSIEDTETKTTAEVTPTRERSTSEVDINTTREITPLPASSTSRAAISKDTTEAQRTTSEPATKSTTTTTTSTSTAPTA